MKKLYINCQSGLSGDMMLGAMISLGVPEEYLRDRLSRLKLDEFELSVREREAGGHSAADVDVILKEPGNLDTDPYSGNYRNYGQILDMINGSSLSSNAKVLSRRIFDIKARAEAKVHQVPVELVKFHEAGAVDSIVDIVGTAICCDYLGADEVIAKEVPTGYGKIRCACGELNVPSPAVRQILADEEIPHYRSEIPQEVLTPTGASILAGVADAFGWEEIKEKETLLSRGYGVGKRETGLPPLELILVEAKES